MGAIFNILEQFRLESYYNQFFQLGVKDERDFLDGVTDEDLNNIGEMNFNLKPNTIKKCFAAPSGKQTYPEFVLKHF